MPVRFRYDGSISGGTELTRAEIDALAAQGFRSILDLDQEGEPGQALSPNVEATWAHANAMQHARADAPGGRYDGTWVERALRALKSLSRPVYVRSRDGRRAAALVTIHMAEERGWGAERALAAAEHLGIDYGHGFLRELVRDEIERRAARGTHPVLHGHAL